MTDVSPTDLSVLHTPEPALGTSPGFAPLTPVTFLHRAEHAYRDRPAWSYEGERATYGEFARSCRQLAALLADLDVQPGDRVAVLAPNTPLLLSAHYAVPMAGAVLVALNTRLSAPELAGIVAHAGARVLLHDDELAELAGQLDAPTVLSASEVDRRLASAGELDRAVSNELRLLALNYTSGTTGRPKGVMYSHRGAYLQALAMAFHSRLGMDSAYLWTLPMFHCNGWSFPWAVTAAGALHVCLRRPDAEDIWRLVRSEGVTALHAAPTVLTSFAYSPRADEGPLPRPLAVGTGGAPPSPALIARLDALGVHVTHLYGLTEVYGPSVVNENVPEWGELDAAERARLMARQGTANVAGERVRVLELAADEEGAAAGPAVDVPADGETIGEVALHGNTVMLGYFQDADATAAAVPDGWFRSGDLAVMHPDGRVELRDRAKDVIISGGENIASIEVEQVLAAHPAVLEVAVVAAPHEKWGEVPVAFVTLKEGADADADDILESARGSLARFKVPKAVHFGPLPKSGTGKILKYRLREPLWAGQEKRNH
ncbi:MAG: AMP-binding protein [Actinomycetota bacterium]|nr:AMP-binding protein [Actinomycetota bacterium]